MDDTVTLADIPTLDITSLTLGEMAAVEADSGRSFDAILSAGAATRRLLALWVAEHRAPRSPSSEPPRSWHELSALRPLAGASSRSRSRRDSRSATSKA